MRLGPVSFQAKAAGRKLAPIRYQPISGTRWKRPHPVAPFCCSTYVSIEATCPKHCVFKNRGCYAQHGIAAAQMRRLDAIAKASGTTGTSAMRYESALIDKMFPWGIPQDGAVGGRDLRLHVGGDCPTTEGAVLLASAALNWVLRGGGTVWTYTHNWRTIPRDAWGPIKVLASVESRRDAAKAIKLGYRPCIVATKGINCLAQLGKSVCILCRNCLSDSSEPVIIHKHGRWFGGQNDREHTAKGKGQTPSYSKGRH